jgi:hypothetical protein
MEAGMRRQRLDTTRALLSALADGWSLLPEDEQQRLARHVELVRFRAGASIGSPGVPGTWCTAVVKGAVATTSPSVVHTAGSSFEHGPETAVVGLEDGVVLTWPSTLLVGAGTPLRLYPPCADRPTPAAGVLTMRRAPGTSTVAKITRPGQALRGI